jgi:hypothetical protein
MSMAGCRVYLVYGDTCSVLGGIRTLVLNTVYVTFPSQSANSGLPLLCAAHRSHTHTA